MNNTKICDFLCQCGRPIKNEAKICGCCHTQGLVTLRATYNGSTEMYRWELFMGEPTEELRQLLCCLSCSRPIVTQDRCCIVCRMYCRLELKKVPGTIVSKQFGVSSCHWELHQFVSSDDVLDRLGEHLIVKHEIQTPEPVENEMETPQSVEADPVLERYMQEQREKEALREKAIGLLKNNSYRQTAEILGMSVGKLQYLVKEDK